MTLCILTSPVQPTAKILATGHLLQPYRAAWDRMAVEARRPYCAPEWMLAWWAHARPRGAALRVVVALSEDRLIGIAPLFVSHDRLRVARYAFIAAAVGSRVEPLARAGREQEVALAIARALATTRPAVDLIQFEGVPSDSPWPGLLADAWPGGSGAWLRREQAIPAPLVGTGSGDFELWMKSKSSNFRQQMRRSRRQLEAAGATFRTADHDSMDRDLESFARLHHARWARRGGSSALSAGIAQMLAAAGGPLCDAGRFRLESIDIGQRTISSQLFVAAGPEMSYWLGGFDEAWAGQRPTQVALVAAVEEAHQRGYHRLDLGPGGMGYKYRLADREERLDWLTFVPRGHRYALVRARLLPHALRQAIASRLSVSAKQRALRVLQALRVPTR